MDQKPDHYLINMALNMWANWIETKDPCMSAQDAINCKRVDKLQGLGTDQMKLIVRLRELADKQFKTTK